MQHNTNNENRLLPYKLREGRESQAANSSGRKPLQIPIHPPHSQNYQSAD